MACLNVTILIALMSMMEVMVLEDSALNIVDSLFVVSKQKIKVEQLKEDIKIMKSSVLRMELGNVISVI